MTCLKIELDEVIFNFEMCIYIYRKEGEMKNEKAENQRKTERERESERVNIRERAWRVFFFFRERKKGQTLKKEGDGGDGGAERIFRQGKSEKREKVSNRVT